MPLQEDFKNLVNLLDIGVIVLGENHKTLLWNPFIARITGVEKDLALGRSLEDIFNSSLDPALTDAIDQCIEIGLARRLSHQLHPNLLPLFQLNNQQPLHHSILVQPVIYQKQPACLLQIADVTSTVRREQHLRSAMEQVRYLAQHDSLTGLANRSLLVIELQKLYDLVTQDQQPFALLFIDLDGFKLVNDRHGHEAGDNVLQVLARRLQTSLDNFSHNSGLAARLGGDEMVALIPNVSNSDQLFEFASHLCDVLAEPLEWQGQKLQVGASIGIALGPQQGNSPKALMKSADNAMYLAKAQGKGQAMRALNT
ncbi:diguanylate cyclase domain-containing protein [Marinospirillum insulare]|uniref:Diguanylate cyclase (GGDEF) domain-containing protein n=1 Tax=Marinospirillum insulare TaxID=217169 RepID=A0ABQ5ZZI5_9GAMM|nr:diguanylate cyclase [Marinospirillum insulare]GLR64718.1 hypothetical protein GCM10007878_21560 [Marinospirillum insulare]